ncbi:Rne/Rng family ribonuclease [Janibacter sp. GXQ6167]|uniref:Rne/Rng family ribonuclease n=1 Tax=Janibacter sp. GXQ6167 TaxID=3240791 RepID=UPI0035237D63
MATDETTDEPTGDERSSDPGLSPDAPTQDELLAVAAAEGPTDADSAEPEEAEEPTEEVEEAPATPTAAGMSFGLLFQAPEPVAAPPRRREPEPQDEPEAETTEEDQSAEGDEGGGGRRRRRRGGRGRNKGSEASDGDSGETADTASEEDSEPKKTKGRGSKKGQKASDRSADQQSTEEHDPAEDAGDDSSEGGSRRRRRRRRSGSGAAESDDPPGTVTKVREPRKDRDEPQAVKGSTRLEAKKQRRREGREAGRRRTIITEAEFLARRESVERSMIVRALQDRTQIGVLEDDVLVEHYVSRETTSTMVGNVYLGRVQNVLPSMEAAFVDIGKGRNAVLYAGEVNWDAAGLGNGEPRRIENALKGGDSVLVQVTKDPIGHKGARLTSQVSLPGRYLVYVPEGSMTGISRKLPEGERARLKSILKEVVPSDAGVIVRTAAEGASETELRRDVERLTLAWEKIRDRAESKKDRKASAGGAPTLLHAEPDMTVRVIRDIFNEDFASMVVSGDAAWQEINGYLGDVAPDLASRLTKWTGEKDIFAEHRIDEQLAKAMDRKVWLPSGGSLVIDRTEAMTVVDVNTGKFVGSGGNLEETVTKNNIEAAEEIVRQLRLRDIGGIIVIDFIDMVLESNRDLVVRRLLECLGRDRTKHQVAEVTSLGLVQMTRKRVGSGLIEVFSEPCEQCHGRGIIVHTEPVASEANGGGGGTQGGSRSRRGSRGSKGEQQAKETPQPEEKSSNGPTAAQIAAAAHAAAVKSMSDEDVEASEEVSQDAPREVIRESDGDDDRAEARPESDAGPVEDSQPAPEPAREPAPKRRRGHRRAGTSSAPVALEPVDLTAAPTSAPALTTVAGEASDGLVADPTPEPATPTRRKRARVVAPAGPPKPLDEADES